MKKSKILLKFWPMLFIIVLCGVFALPYLLKGLVPFPSDYLVNNFSPWNAYPGFAGPVKNAAQPDVITQIFPWKELVIDSWKSGDVPLWNQYSFSGTPLLANYQSASLSPINTLYFILPFIDAWSVQVLLQSFFAGVFTYIFVRSLKKEREASLISAVAFMFCGFITGWLSYGTLGYAIVFLPLALFGVEKFYESKKWYYFVLLTFTIPLSFFSGHFQTSLYFLMFILAYIVFKSIQTKNAKYSICSLVSVFLGVLLCMPQLVPSIEFYLEAVRSSTFIATEKIPWNYLPTFFAPDYFGNPVTRNDWFGHYAEWGAYIGLVPLMLALYAMKKRTSYVVFFAITSLVSLLLAFQTPFQDLLYALKIPVLSTSAASRIIVIFSFSAAVLSAFGLETLISDIKDRKIRPILIWLGSVVLVFGILWFVTLSYNYFPVGMEQIAKSNLKLPSIILATIALVVFCSFFVKNKKVLMILPLVLLLITAFDVYRFASKWQTFGDRSLIYPDVPVSKFIKNLDGFDRGQANFGGEAAMTLKLPVLDGYDPLFVKRYGEFIEAAKDGLYHTPPRSGIALNINGEFTPTIINLLGVKYIVYKIGDDRQPWAFPVWKYPTDQFVKRYEDSSYWVYENQKVYPRAMMVGDYEVIKDDRKILRQIFSDETDLRNKVILEEDPGLKTEQDASATAKIVYYKANKIEIETSSTKPQILFLSEPFYRGWKVRVDGGYAKTLRANYAFRAVPLNQGKHTVTFTYVHGGFRIGLAFGALGVAGLVASLIYLRRR